MGESILQAARGRVWLWPMTEVTRQKRMTENRVPGEHKSWHGTPRLRTGKPGSRWVGLGRGCITAGPEGESQQVTEGPREGTASSPQCRRGVRCGLTHTGPT